MSKRPAADVKPRFPFFGTMVAALRKQALLEQDELAAKARISVDQVRRIEQGENVGLWYVASVLAALKHVRDDDLDRQLTVGLATDGQNIMKSGALADRLTHPNIDQRPREAGATRGEEPMPTAKRRHKTA